MAINPKEKYRLYIGALQKWQKAVNLVAPSTLKDIYGRHIADGIALSDYIKSIFEGNTGIQIFDIGSGAGFPGMVLAIEGFGNTKLIESDSKKASFLNNIKMLYQLNNVNILNQRLERVGGNPDVITSRAFKSVEETIELASGIIKSRTHIILLKGQNVQHEIDEALKHFAFDYDLIKNTNTTSNGYILHIKNVRLNPKNT